MTETPQMPTPEAEAETAAPQAVPVDPMLLNALVCPLTHTPLSYDHVRNELISKKAKLAFPIREGVPIMLPSQARELG